MSKRFFNLENIMLGSMFLILLIYSGFMLSCNPKDSSDLPSNSGNTGDESRTRACSDRDACQDSCENMFRNTGARGQCYDLSFAEIGKLEYVFRKLSSSDIGGLQNINATDFENFIKLDTDGWLDIIIGDRKDNIRPAYDSPEAQRTLEWIAENKPIALAIKNQDTYHDILYHLFLRLGIGKTGPTLFQLTDEETGSNGVMNIKWDSNNLTLNDTTDAAKAFSLSLSGLSGSVVLQFVLSFILIDKAFNKKSFIIYAKDEENDDAVTLAHNSLIRFCESATDNEFPHKKVQQCMLAAYCSIRENEKSDSIFKDALSSYDASQKDCGAEVLKEGDDSKIKDLFN